MSSSKFLYPPCLIHSHFCPSHHSSIFGRPFSVPLFLVIPFPFWYFLIWSSIPCVLFSMTNHHSFLPYLVNHSLFLLFLILHVSMSNKSRFPFPFPIPILPLSRSRARGLCVTCGMGNTWRVPSLLPPTGSRGRAHTPQAGPRSPPRVGGASSSRDR